MSISILESVVIAVDEEYGFEDYTAVYMWANWDGGPERVVSLVNHGLIYNSFGGYQAAVIEGSATYIGNDGVIAAEATGANAWAYGINGAVRELFNGNLIAAQGDNAAGVSLWAVADHGVANAGAVLAYGGEYAVGIHFNNAASSFRNDGIIEVDVTDAAPYVPISGAGVRLERRLGSFLNAGSIFVDDHGSTAPSSGILYDFSNQNAAVQTIENRGVITADFAIRALDSWSIDNSPENVINSGTLNGKVDLGRGDDVLTNTGWINGVVDLGWGSNSYFGAGALGGVFIDSSRGGNDLLLGGAGQDTVSYAGAFTYVTVDLRFPYQQNTDGGGLDTITGFENVTGSGYDDRLWGNSVGNTLRGMGGDDQLDGGLGNDTLDGGSGFDTANYGSSTSYVTIDLDYGSIQNTDAAGLDTFASIERVIGGAYDDRFWGSDANNFLHGGVGQDQLSGRGGEDLLDGGANHDILTGGAGPDVFVFRSTSDTHWDFPDRITDFATGDRIDIGDIDANTTVGGDQAFHIATTPEAAGVYISYDAGSNRTTLRLDTDGDGNPEGRIWLDGDHRGLTVADFVL